MAVVVETTLGDITIDLYVSQRPRACQNFLKLCKMKYYNFNLFHTVNQGFIAQTGDPTGVGDDGESIWGVIDGPLRRYFEAETNPRIKHTREGLISFVGQNNMIGSQFFITLGSDLTYLDAKHCVFGEITEGIDIIHKFNEAICDNDHRPYQDIRITHTVVLEDPFPDPERFKAPDCSPEATAERLQGGRIAPDEEIDETAGKSAEEIAEIVAEREAKARATILEMVGDIPDAEMAPPENVLFVCKLNPVTNDDDLEIIFSRFGKIKSCEVIRDKKTGDSLQYAFVEFEERKACEDAYFKMDNVLIDDRRIHVDFSQSVAKVKWLGKGRGVTYYTNKGEKRDDPMNDFGNGKYERRRDDRSPEKHKNGNEKNGRNNNYSRERKRDERRHDDRRNRREDRRNSRERDDRRYDRKRNNDRRDEDRRRDRYYEEEYRHRKHEEKHRVRSRKHDNEKQVVYEEERTRKCKKKHKDLEEMSSDEERHRKYKKRRDRSSSQEKEKYSKKEKYRKHSNSSDDDIQKYKREKRRNEEYHSESEQNSRKTNRKHTRKEKSDSSSSEEEVRTKKSRKIKREDHSSSDDDRQKKNSKTKTVEYTEKVRKHKKSKKNKSRKYSSSSEDSDSD